MHNRPPRGGVRCASTSAAQRRHARPRMMSPVHDEPAGPTDDLQPRALARQHSLWFQAPIGRLVRYGRPETVAVECGRAQSHPGWAVVQMSRSYETAHGRQCLLAMIDITARGRMQANAARLAGIVASS